MFIDTPIKNNMAAKLTLKQLLLLQFVFKNILYQIMATFITKPHRQEKEREVLRCGKTCEDKNTIRNVKNHTHCSTRVQREENGQQI